MKNFETELDRAGAVRLEIRERVGVHQTVSVQSVEARTDLINDVWGWEALRDYVVHQITDRWGPFPSTPKEIGIFKGFITRWGAEQSKAIAKAAFEVYEGRWAGAPVSIWRFCAASDPFFATPIAQQLPASL